MNGQGECRQTGQNNSRIEKGHWTRNNIRALAAVIGGNILYALGVHLFLIPAGLITGGTTGIALAVQKLTGFPVSRFVLVFNGLMLAAGYMGIGRSFAAKTVVSTFVYPAALEMLERTLGRIVLTEDRMLCAVFGGLLIGASLGLVIRCGASTGGMDIPCILLWKKMHIPVSVSLYAFDCIILLLQAMLNPPERVLYGILLVIIYSIVLDKVMILGTGKIEIKVISQASESIRKAILERVDRGVTMLSARSGFMGKPLEMVLTVISGRELAETEKIIHEIDPEAFLVVSRVSEVRGRGFSMQKQYK